METITKEQFDNLQVGDTLKNHKYTLSVEAKFANSVILLMNEEYTYIYSLKELQGMEYSITTTIQHKYGFPYGDYSDREVIVKISNASIEIYKRRIYTRLITVNEEGFRDDCGELFKFAVLASNNVDLVK